MPPVWKKCTLQYNKRGQRRTRTKAVLQITTNKTRSHPALLYLTTKDSFPSCCMGTSGGLLGTVRGSVRPNLVVKSNDLNLLFRNLNYQYTPFHPDIICPPPLCKPFLVVTACDQMMLSTVTTLTSPFYKGAPASLV